LQNLAWFALSRPYKMTDIEGYKKLLERLPVTSHLSLRFPRKELDQSSTSKESSKKDKKESEQPSTSKKSANEAKPDVPAKRRRSVRLRNLSKK
jgi:hypothetical protein